jgi:hypothetical protein
MTEPKNNRRERTLLSQTEQPSQTTRFIIVFANKQTHKRYLVSKTNTLLLLLQKERSWPTNNRDYPSIE